MATYITNEAQFEIGDGWEDQSVTVFAFPMPNSRMGLVITKQALQEGETPEAVLDRHLRTSSQKLRRFNLIERKGRTVSGLQGWDARFTFTHDGLSLYQRQVYVLYGDLLWALTGTSVDERRVDCDLAFDKLVGSLKFRRPTSP